MTPVAGAGRVVLDADVLHALPLRDTLLTLAAHPHSLFDPCWSSNILDEVARSLDRRLGAPAGQRAAAAIQTAFPVAQAHVPTAWIARMPNHPKDRHVLALAVTVPAPVVVTHNVRDFTGAERFGVAVRHPDRFLCDLLSADPDIVRAAIDSQAAALRRPATTRRQLLERLAANGLTQFARRLAE